jgi:hypothetical protein
LRDSHFERLTRRIELAQIKELAMKRTMVRYKVKPEHAAENRRLVEGVFKELREKAFPGVRYATLQSGDGWVTHFTTVDGDGVNPITTLDAFKTYLAGVRERVVEPPQQANDVTVIGNYKMIGDWLEFSP